jgi:hypothetical protein
MERKAQAGILASPIEPGLQLRDSAGLNRSSPIKRRASGRLAHLHLCYSLVLWNLTQGLHAVKCDGKRAQAEPVISRSFRGRLTLAEFLSTEGR